MSNFIQIKIASKQRTKKFQRGTITKFWSYISSIFFTLLKFKKFYFKNFCPLFSTFILRDQECFVKNFTFFHVLYCFPVQWHSRYSITFSCINVYTCIKPATEQDPPKEGSDLGIKPDYHQTSCSLLTYLLFCFIFILYIDSYLLIQYPNRRCYISSDQAADQGPTVIFYFFLPYNLIKKCKTEHERKEIFLLCLVNFIFLGSQIHPYPIK